VTTIIRMSDLMMVLSLGTLQDLVLHIRTAGLISKLILILVRFRKIQKSTAQPLQ